MGFNALASPKEQTWNHILSSLLKRLLLKRKKRAGMEVLYLDLKDRVTIKGSAIR